MKAKEFTNEMSWRAPSFEKQADLFASQNMSTWYEKGVYIGDVEQYKLKQYRKYYSLWNDSELIAYTSLDDRDLVTVVDDVWVKPEYRGHKLFSMMLWFYKTRLGKSRMLIGPAHSPMMQEVVKGLKYFKKNWYNIRTKDVEPFSLDTLDNFYGSVGSTDWRIILENNGDFCDWPMFRTNSSFIKESYLPYVEEDYDPSIF